MGNIFGGRNSFFNKAGRDINRAVINAGHWAETGVQKTTNAALKQAKASLRDLEKTGAQAGKDWKNAGRGEIGKYTSGLMQSAYNFTLAPARAVVTGQYGKEFQKGLGSFVDLSSAGTLSYIGRSPSLLKELKKDQTFLGSNIAGLAHGTATTSKDGKLNKSDKNQILQGAVKVGVAYGGYYAGKTAYSSYVASQNAAASSAAAASSSGSATGFTTAKLGTDVAGAGVAGSEGAAASAGGWTTTDYLLATSAASSGVGILTGKKSVGQGLTEILNPSTTPDLGFIGDLFKNPARGPTLSSDPMGGMGSYGGDNVVSSDAMFYVAAAAAVAVGFIVLRKVL